MENVNQHEVERGGMAACAKYLPYVEHGLESTELEGLLASLHGVDGALREVETKQCANRSAKREMEKLKKTYRRDAERVYRTLDEKSSAYTSLTTICGALDLVGDAR
jgi:hypothetical protein